MPDSLPPRQRDALEALEVYWREHGVAPSLGDLARILGVSRPTAHAHVRALRRKGYIDAREGVPRSWRPRGRGVQVPIVGRVAAGAPILAEEHVDGWITVDRPRTAGVLFALRVHGDSMVDGGILDGDLVMVRQQDTALDGEIVVALVGDDEATVKKLRRAAGQVHLVPMNPDYEPIVIEEGQVRVLGKVIGLQRRLEEEQGDP